jgi:hypothetical protein
MDLTVTQISHRRPEAHRCLRGVRLVPDCEGAAAGARPHHQSISSSPRTIGGGRCLVGLATVGAGPPIPPRCEEAVACGGATRAAHLRLLVAAERQPHAATQLLPRTETDGSALANTGLWDRAEWLWH